MASYANENSAAEAGSAHPDEGKIIKKKVCMDGQWFPVNLLMDHMVNKGHRHGAAFAALAKNEQADILAGRRTLDLDGPLPEGCAKRQWMGSQSGGCDVCCVVRIKTSDDAPGLDLTTCPRCKYAACANCRAPDTTCYCKDSNFGVAYGTDRKPWETGYW